MSKVRTSFDQSKQIHERKKSGNIGNVGRGRPKGSKNKARAKDGTNRGRPAGSKNKERDLTNAFDIDVNKFIKELNKQTKNKLFQYADTMLASVIFANATVIEEIMYDIKEQRVGMHNVDDMKGLLSALKGSTAEVVNAIKALGLAASNREEEIGGDRVFEALTDLDLAKVLPPSLQGEYIAATEDIARTEGVASPEEEEATLSLLQQLKKPIQLYEREAEAEDTDRTSVVKPEQEGIGELG